jgi:hypothetical protein
MPLRRREARVVQGEGRTRSAGGAEARRRAETTMSCERTAWKGVPRRTGRRGQTLILAIGILLLMVVLGAAFVTMIARNLQRAGRYGATDDALALALAGIQYAAQQFRTSELGSDWRPRPTEVLWRTPAPPNLPPTPLVPPHPRFGATLEAAELRELDPDRQWLSDGGTFRNPYVRISTGRGRFLLRVTYLPRYRVASRASTTDDEFDPNSGVIHVESIGRPGEFDANDPTFFALDLSDADQGTLRKVEAFLPLGLVDQLRWITNVTGERGPAHLGVPPFVTADGRALSHPTLFQGAIRSDVDLQFEGRNVVRLYPARGDALVVKGRLLLSTRGNDSSPAEAAEPPLRVEPLADTGNDPSIPAWPPGGPAVIPPDRQDDNPADDTMLVSIPITELAARDDAQLRAVLAQSILLTQGGDVQTVIRDERQLRQEGEDLTRSVRLQGPPRLDQLDPATGVNRYFRLTALSGGTIEVQDTDGTGTRLVNAGQYSLTDQALPPQIRARGLYLDNWGDIQIPHDRHRIKSIWMNPRAPEAQKYGWSDDLTAFLPRVEEEGVSHPIAEVQLTRVLETTDNGTRLKPVLRITRYDRDQREQNLPPENGRSYDRKFYRLEAVTAGSDGGAGRLVPVGTTRDFDWPENGVFYAEGSIRVRGVAGVPFDGDTAQSIEETRPRPLTIVSNGTIYVEGNLLAETPGWQLALMARDYVTLNPTALWRLRPSTDVGPATPDVPGEPGRGFHYLLNQGSHLDFSMSAAANLLSGVLHLRHSGQAGETPLTAVVLNLPFLSPVPAPWPDWARDRYDFGANIPPVAPPLPDPPYSGLSALHYLFREISPGDPNHWHESDRRSAEGAPDHERKTFYLPGLTSSGGPLPRGLEATFRLEVPPKDLVDPALIGNDQPYWLSRLALLPADRPLPVRVEAVIYAFTGSFFVIPPPYFNQEEADTRGGMLATGVRAPGTLPRNLDLDPNGVAVAQQYPFYGEPLNVDIQVVGAITENMPAAPHEVAEWTRRTWTADLDGDPTNGNADNLPTVWPTPNPDDPSTWVARGRSLFSPRLAFRYDYNLQRMVRVRVLATGRELVAWSAPDSALRPPGVPLLNTVILDALTTQNSYVELLPLLPRLPAGTLVYEGNPL